MKLVQIAGWLGSGKTTLVIALAKALGRDGLKVAIVVNEIGAVPVDGKVIEEYGLTVKDIGGGCICCQVAGTMLNTIRVLAGEIRPDIIMVEPTGMAVPGSVAETVRAGAGKAGIEMGPVIVLLDTTREEKLLHYETLKRLIMKQLTDADIIALSKADMVTEDTLAGTAKAVADINPDAKVIILSAKTGEGVEALVDSVEGSWVRT